MTMTMSMVTLTKEVNVLNVYGGLEACTDGISLTITNILWVPLVFGIGPVE